MVFLIIGGIFYLTKYNMITIDLATVGVKWCDCLAPGGPCPGVSKTVKVLCDVKNNHVHL